MEEAIIIEHNLKGECWRYALTYEEFSDKFNPWLAHGVPYPQKEGSVYKFRSDDHMWYKPCTVGSAEWNRFFTEMNPSMFAGIITARSSVYVRESYMMSLKEFLPKYQTTPDQHNYAVFVRRNGVIYVDATSTEQAARIAEYSGNEDVLWDEWFSVENVQLERKSPSAQVSSAENSIEDNAPDTGVAAMVSDGQQNKLEIAQLVTIARNNILELSDRSDLEPRDNDSDDFFTTSVWSLKKALLDAYNLGREQAISQTAEKTPSALDSVIRHADARATRQSISVNKTDIEHETKPPQFAR